MASRDAGLEEQLQQGDDVDFEDDNHVLADGGVANESQPMKTMRSAGGSANSPGRLHDLVYALEDSPPWYTTIFLGIQHFMTTFGSIISAAFLLSQSLCISHDAVTSGKLIGTLFVVNGLVTLLQSTVGVRLPIIQGTSFAFLVPAYSILNLRGDCPFVPTGNSTAAEIAAMEEEWLARIREIQGAIMVASCVQIIVGATGIVGILLSFIGPLAIAPTITLIGLSLLKSAAVKSGQHWGVAIMTIAIIILFSQFLQNVAIPCVRYTSERKCNVTRFQLFKLFPIILGIAVSWLLCVIFTAADVFPDDPNEYGYAARTDLNSMALESAPWFRFPYPGQWGTPTVTLFGILGIMAGVFASIVESIGDYYACARLSGAPPPPQHAINRGVLVEGIGCLLAGAWGAGNGTTSHSENIGAIGLTKVGSRVVVQAAGCVMICVGVVGKICALVATMPNPIVGAVICVTFGMVAAVGLSNLQFVDLNSSRNLFVLGFSIQMGLVVPLYVEQNPGSIKTGSVELDQILTVVLTTSMFVGGLLAILLDNTIPGTDGERGLEAWRQQFVNQTEDEDGIGAQEIYPVEEEGRGATGSRHQMTEMGGCRPGVDEVASSPSMAANVPGCCYDLPFGMRYIRRWSWCRYLPFSPTFTGFRFHPRRCCKAKC